MDIKSEIKKRTKEIEEILGKFLPEEEGHQRIIMEAMNYSLLSGGKRLRPMLMLETYRMFGGREQVIEPFMAAIELIHTYSLVHDDLPAMDNDEYRRGRKTTHIVYGEAMGILAGDALLNYAFETACRAFRVGKSLPQVARAFQILAGKAGIHGMIGGQVVDVQNEGNPDMDEEKLRFIYELKTGALIEAAMTIGAVLAEAEEPEIQVLEQVASDVGMAFQIQDDLLDVTSTLEELGKPIGSDAKNQKVTYVTLSSIEQAKDEVSRLTGQAVMAMKNLPVQNEFLTQLLLYLINRKY